MFIKWRTLSKPIVQSCSSLKQQCCEKQLVKYLSTMDDKILKLPPRYGKGEKSVWVEYNQLVAEHKPKVNLGQGFPDFPPPQNVTEALGKLSLGPEHIFHQYTRSFGHPSLVKNLARLYSPLINREIDPMQEVLVTSGAYEALFSAILGFVDSGDEVIVIEPFFDCYTYMIVNAGGKPIGIPLQPKNKNGCEEITSADWVLDENKLRSLFNDKTKMIILNTPHNPLGKVFTRSEMQLIADLCKKHNVICVADEVYEWITYDKPHIRMATLPDMWQRTITIGSAGKSFSVTGWKIGWAYGPKELMRNMQVVHQNTVYTCTTPTQEALARVLDIELARFGSDDCVFQNTVQKLAPKRAKMVDMLRRNGFNPVVPDGGYFIIADWTPLANKIDLSQEPDPLKDYKFTKKYAKDVGVLAIPPSAFYSDQYKSLGENYARFCFCKKDENLQLADDLMSEWLSKSKSSC